MNKKKEALLSMGALNKQPEYVICELFKKGGNFFDPNDKLQVKYEMIRAVKVDCLPISSVARDFGFSRETYYRAAKSFELEGCVGLLDQAQERRQPEKLQTEIIEFIHSQRQKDPKANSGYKLAKKIFERFHVRIHPRTVYKVLKKMTNKSSHLKLRRKAK